MMVFVDYRLFFAVNYRMEVTGGNQDFLPTKMAAKKCDSPYCRGNPNIQEVLHSVEALREGADSWELVHHLSTPRSGVNAVVLEDRIYVLGGFDGMHRLKSVECFSFGFNDRIFAHHVPDMNRRRSNFAASVYRGKIYVSGKGCHINHKARKIINNKSRSGNK